MLAEKRNLVRNTAANAAAQLAAMFVGFVFMPFLVKTFGLMNYGLFVLVTAVSGYAALLDLGIGSALVRAVAEERATGDRTRREEALGTAIVFYTVIGLFTFVVMMVIGQLSWALFDISGEQADIVRNMLFVGAVLQLWLWPASTARHVLAGLQRYDVIAKTSFLSTGLGALSTIVVVVTHQGPVFFVAINGLAGAIATFAMVLEARRLSGVRRPEIGLAAWPVLRRMLVFGTAVAVIDVADVLFYQHTDRLILGIVLGAAAVALYEAAAKINGLVTYLSGLTVSAVMPLASRLDAAGEQEALTSLFVRGTKYGSAFIAPIAGVLVVLANALLSQWLGSDFAEQYRVMQMLVFPHAIICLGLMGDAVLIARGRMGKRIPFIVAQAIGNVALSAILVQPALGIGVMGVAIGTAVAHLVDFPIHIWFLLRETGVSFSDWLRRIVMPVYAPLLLPLAIAWGLMGTPLGESLPGIGAIAAIALGVYWIVFYRFSLSGTERRDFGAVFASFRR